MKSQRGSIDSQVKPDRPSQHHQSYKTLGSERRDARPHMGAHKQSARRSSHRKPKPFQDMGKFSYARSHRRNPREREDIKLGHFGAVWKTVAMRGGPPRATMNACRFN